MVDSLEVFELLKSGDLPDSHARAMTMALQKAESGIALDLKSVIESQFALFGARIEARFEAIEGQLGAIHLRLTKLEDRFTNLEDRLTKLEDRVGKLEDRVGKLEDRVGQLEDRLDKLVDRVQHLDVRLSDTKAELIRWNFMFWVAQLAAIATILKLLK
jgi:chromosome segregation ATPase